MQGAGVVIENIDAQKLFTTLQNLTPDKLKAMNEIIVDKQAIMQIEDMSRRIETSCYSWKT